MAENPVLPEIKVLLILLGDIDLTISSKLIVALVHRVYEHV